MEHLRRAFIFGNVIDAVPEFLQNRRYFVKNDPFEYLSDELFIKKFRVNKELARFLITLLDPLLLPPSRRSAVSKQLKVLVALNFFATGSYQSNVGNNILCGGVSQSTVSRCVEEVCNVLNNAIIFNQWIKFPQTRAELEQIRTDFFQQYNIPGIIGVIDCTHIAIIPPSRNNDEHIYVNRKHYHSLNVQLVCDINLKITNINARFPGSTGDAHIWNNSALSIAIQNLHQRRPEFYLIGDSGYPHRPWLHVPIPDAQEGTPAFRYNQAFRNARCLIERCNGLLKMRWRCLLKHRVLHHSPEKAAKITNACAVLHNMCIDYNVDVPAREEGDEEIDFGIYHDYVDLQLIPGINPDLQRARHMQQRIVINYFGNN